MNNLLHNLQSNAYLLSNDQLTQLYNESLIISF